MNNMMNDLQNGKTDHIGVWAIGTMLVLILAQGACMNRPTPRPSVTKEQLMEEMYEQQRCEAELMAANIEAIEEHGLEEVASAVQLECFLRVVGEESQP